MSSQDTAAQSGPSLSEIAATLAAIAAAQHLDSRLWDAEDVALFLKLNTDYCRANIVTRGDFPAAVELPGAGKAAKPKPIRRWRPVDVRDWAEKWRS